MPNFPGICNNFFRAFFMPFYVYKAARQITPGRGEGEIMIIINLTPDAINFVGPLFNEDGSIYCYETYETIEPSGQVARVTTKTVPVIETELYLGGTFSKHPMTIEGIPVTMTEFGEVEGLPDPKPGVVYIVSSLVAQRVPDRWDVFIPNESVRDSQGRIGYKSLGRI